MTDEPRRIVVGITGGIAVYKTCELIRQVVKCGWQVRVAATEHALRFITPLTLETLSRNPLEVTLFPNDGRVEPRHIELARWADALIIAPATANVIAKIRCGIADDLLTSTVLAYDKPLLIAPAMNTAMWENPATQENVAILKSRGHFIIGPETGELAASNELPGAGRMVEPERLFLELQRHFDRTDAFQNQRVLIAAGPTCEPIDSVRVIKNLSTGTLGITLAEQFHRAGAHVTLLLGDTHLQAPEGITCFRFSTVQSLDDLLAEHLATQDVWVMAAAVSDRKPVTPSSASKIKNSDLGDALAWEPTKDLLASHAPATRDDQLVVGFALEAEWNQTEALRKLKAKQVDLLVWNNPLSSETGFGNHLIEARFLTNSQITDSTGAITRNQLSELILSACRALQSSRTIVV